MTNGLTRRDVINGLAGLIAASYLGGESDGLAQEVKIKPNNNQYDSKNICLERKLNNYKDVNDFLECLKPYLEKKGYTVISEPNENNKVQWEFLIDEKPAGVIYSTPNKEIHIYGHDISGDNKLETGFYPLDSITPNQIYESLNLK